MYDNMEKKNCEGCGNEFEYYTFAMTIPTHCRECQRVVAAEQRKGSDKKRREEKKKVVKPPKVKIPKVVKEEMVKEEVKTESTPPKLSDELEALIKHGSIPGVKTNLIIKYGDIRKLTGILNKKS